MLVGMAAELLLEEAIGCGPGRDIGDGDANAIGLQRFPDGDRIGASVETPVLTITIAPGPWRMNPPRMSSKQSDEGLGLRCWLPG